MVHFLHFVTLFSHIIFGIFFAIFDPPLCLILSLGYMDLKPEIHDLTVESAKKQTLVIDFVHFLIPLCLWSFLAILGFWGAFGGMALS